MGEDEDAVDKELYLVEVTLKDGKPLLRCIYPFPKKQAGTSITVYVTGYDTSLSEIDVGSALRKHFSSCGETITVSISKKFAQDKVMELDGSDMGGCKSIYIIKTQVQNWSV
ncbi:hypothetical protein F2Q70_00029351 [Brassica cretica]|uniref:Uncharacterized protein n=1 Tax=Brassica cretica TaxID=69181 RepID=A0A8S9FGM4_BRACR|nr:hypothetical protein F2Q70_00029351 [Brassica cretica]KAF2551579.1 hypothetical protein F2Q68_00033724 [Brassica cretica]